MAISYLDKPGFILASVMPPDDVARLEERRPGYLERTLELRSAEINAQLTKRYAVPFAAPVPEIVILWLVRIVTMDAYLALGFAPSSVDEEIVKASVEAKGQIVEASKSETGLYELPLRADTTAEGVSKGGPVVLYETSPYAWMWRQYDEAKG